MPSDSHISSSRTTRPRGNTHSDSRDSMASRTKDSRDYGHSSSHVPSSSRSRAPSMSGSKIDGPRGGSKLNPSYRESNAIVATYEDSRASRKPSDSTVTGKSRRPSSGADSRMTLTGRDDGRTATRRGMDTIGEDDSRSDSHRTITPSRSGFPVVSRADSLAGSRTDFYRPSTKTKDSQALVTRDMSNMTLTTRWDTAGDEIVTSKRFIPLTWSSISCKLVDHLCSVFKVQPGKVKDWCRDELIRADMKNYKEDKMPYNIDLLKKELAPRNLERWDDFARDWKNNKDLEKALGPKGGSFNDFYGSRQTSVAAKPAAAVLKVVVLVTDRYDPRCICCYWGASFCGNPYHRTYFHCHH